MTPPPLCSAQDLADYLGVHVETVYRKAQKGEIPVALKVGPMWRFDREAVRAALAEKAGLKAAKTRETA